MKPELIYGIEGLWDALREDLNKALSPDKNINYNRQIDVMLHYLSLMIIDMEEHCKLTHDQIMEKMQEILNKKYLELKVELQHTIKTC